MKKLDRNSQIVLACLLIFYGWIIFQWDSTAIDPNKAFSLDSSSTPETPKQEEKKVIIPRTGVYISGFSGKVSFNSSTITDSTNSSTSLSSGVYKTNANSWLSLDLGNDQFLIAFEKSEFDLKNGAISINSGKVYLSNVSNATAINSKNVSITPGTNRSDITVITESKKVRVFSILNSVSFTAFGKEESLNAGQGSSIFLDSKRANKYDLGESILIDKSQSTVTWNKVNDAANYILIASKQITTDSYLEHSRLVLPENSKNRSFSNTDDYLDIRVFSENKYGSWSRY